MLETRFGPPLLRNLFIPRFRAYGALVQDGAVFFVTWEADIYTPMLMDGRWGVAVWWKFADPVKEALTLTPSPT